MPQRVMSAFPDPNIAHRKSEEARENDQHLEALKFLEEAFVGYEKEKNYVGFIRALHSRVLAYKHLSLLSNDLSFAVLAEKDGEAALEIAKGNSLNELFSACYFKIGEIAMLFKDYQKASENYQKSVENYVGSKAEKGDFTYHWGEAVWKKSGNARGKELMLEGLSIIQANRSEVDQFLIHVWESGAYMRLAECLLQENPEESRRYFEKGKQIIDSDEKLVIRKKQYQELAKKFK